MSDISAESSSAVIKTCIKLRGAVDFNKTINEVIEDIREICVSDHCGILLLDHEEKNCSVLAESIRAESGIPELKSFFTDRVYDIANNLENTLRGSTCLIIKDDNDREELRARDPLFCAAMDRSGTKTLVLFPLKQSEEIIGYIWSINFNVDESVKIKEILELTTFFLASEISNYQLMHKLELLSSTDMLTGINNRNIMNNRVDRIIAGKDVLKRPYAAIFADLNGLKKVNDELGHEAGDELLRDAASLLKSVFYDGEVYRAGGDEFMIISENIDKAEAYERIGKLKDETNKTEHERFAVGVVTNDEVSDILKAMRTADERMYADKTRYYNEHPELKHR